MAHYVYLISWTAEGIRNVKQGPQRSEAFHKAVEGAGGKVLFDLHTMGAYDAVAAVELPNDDVANQIAIRVGMQGFVRTTTLKGWTAAEFAQMVSKL
jgi:uncharacterized protein with GYD domain